MSREWKSISKIFKSDDNVLYDFGKIAVCVEQAICSFVFPNAFEDGADANLHNLLNILNDSDSPFISRDPDENGCEENLHAAKCEENLHAAKRRWGNICKTFDFPDEWISKSGEWDVYDYNVPGDIRAIEVLKLSQAQIRVTKTLCLEYRHRYPRFSAWSTGSAIIAIDPSPLRGLGSIAIL